MAVSDKVLILANSTKHGGRCVAGKFMGNKEWIRLTKNGADAVPTNEALNYPVLSVLTFAGISRPRVLEYPYQTENVMYSGVKVQSEVEEIYFDDYVDDVDTIFGSTESFVMEEEMNEHDFSLLFVKVTNLRIYYKTYRDYNSSLKCSFRYNGNIYNEVSVTDCGYNERFEENGDYHVERYPEAYLTISLGVPFIPRGETRKRIYKLVSGIFI